MAKTESNKRELKFNSFDELMSEVHSLQEKGYVSSGNWTLGQACSHLADWIQYPMEGFPKPPLPVKFIMWLVKITVGPGMKRKILKEGFSGGMPTAPQSVVTAEEMSDQQGIEKLQSAIDRLRSFDGEFYPSPLFGPTDRETLTRVSLLHAEHHLGYLEPDE